MKLTSVERVQRAYPKIYLACHTRHVRARSTDFRLSSHDSALLVHLDELDPITPSQLAAHLGVQPPTLSAAIHKLEKLGYLQRRQNPKDRRVISLLLTPHGAKAMVATSVLDEKRVSAVLKLLPPRKRTQALLGLDLLAQASTKFMSKKQKGV